MCIIQPQLCCRYRPRNRRVIQDEREEETKTKAEARRKMEEEKQKRKKYVMHETDCNRLVPMCKANAAMGTNNTIR